MSAIALHVAYMTPLCISYFLNDCSILKRSRSYNFILQEGLEIMLAAGNIFKCYKPNLKTSGQVSSVLASLLLIKKGFTLDCLLLRYQGSHLCDSASNCTLIVQGDIDRRQNLASQRCSD